MDNWRIFYEVTHDTFRISMKVFMSQSIVQFYVCKAAFMYDVSVGPIRTFVDIGLKSSALQHRTAAIRQKLWSN